MDCVIWYQNWAFIFVSLKIAEKYLVKGKDPAGLTEIEHYHITLSKTLFFNQMIFADHTPLFAQLIARTAKDIEVLIDSLPSEESSAELQSASLNKLEEDNKESAAKLEEVRIISISILEFYFILITLSLLFKGRRQSS